MTQTSETSQTMLPSGLFDRVGDSARREAMLTHQLMAHFEQCGYLPVQPPLMEYTQTLSGSLQAFQVMDPADGQMLGLRCDMTPQLARIAHSTLKGAPRPLRLCYTGQTLRSRTDTMRQTRQFRQIGIELFGADTVPSDVEVMQIALSGLKALGVQELTLDISLPELLVVLILASDISKDQERDIYDAARHKDSQRLEALGQPLFAQLCAISCDAKQAFETINTLNLPDQAMHIIKQTQASIQQLTERLGDAAPNILLDPFDMSGFGYHSGLSFAIYAKSSPYALGRGGRYRAKGQEMATGFTLYAEDVLTLLDAPQLKPLLQLPAHCDEQTAAHWRAQGYRTIYTLDTTEQTADFILNDALNEVTKVK